MSTHWGAVTADPPRHLRMGGFTLLEIMVAMLLLTVILTSSVSLLFLNIKGWDALTSDSEATLDQMLINDRMHSIIGNLSPLIWQTPEGRRLAFVGLAERLQFISKAPQQHLAGGLFEYLLQAEPNAEGGTALVLYYAPYLPDTAAFRLPDEGKRRVLFAQIENLTFSYYGATQAGSQHDWLMQWDNTGDRLPEVIGVNFTSGETGQVEQRQLITLMGNKAWGR